jgi:hypothetical protein
MIHTYDKWLNESSGMKLKIADAVIERLKRELKQYNSFTQEFGRFEDWWSISKKDYDDEDPAYFEALERIQRKTPENQRYRGDIYYLEFHVKINLQTSVWRLCKMNLVDFTIKIHEDLYKYDSSKIHTNPLGERVKKIFEETVLEMYPGAFHGSKFKL